MRMNSGLEEIVELGGIGEMKPEKMYYAHLPKTEQNLSQPEHDAVNNPKHYTSHPSGVECIQVIEHFGFNLGNVIKYLWRAEEKGAPLEDLKKAAWYLNREIQKREGK